MPIADNVQLGRDVQIPQATLVNLYGCSVGDGTKIGTFVEIQKDARVGRRCKVSSHSFICEGVTIEDEVFIGHGVMFTNDRFPRATNDDGSPQTDADWQVIPTVVHTRASIGSNSTILPGVTVGREALVGAGAVVTRDVPEFAIVAGVRPKSLGMSRAPMIPFVDLNAQYRDLKDEIDRAVAGVLESGQYVLGREAELFEEEFAAYCGTKFAIGVNSGTARLHLSLLAAGIGPGDEVITVPMTFVATVAAVLYAGATPVLVDIDPRTGTMDPARLAEAITARTKAILPVHLYGYVAEMEPILSLARQHSLILLEDAAQAHGALYRGKRAGSLGDLGCFSFYPAKNLGACGEGGAIVTDNPEFARTLRMLRNWGQERRHVHELAGYNYRLDGLQAAVLRVKLRRLEDWNARRRSHARDYGRLLAEFGVKTPISDSEGRHVYHVYALRTANRDRMLVDLERRGIQAAVHYPFPVHLQPAYNGLGYSNGDFPVSEALAKEEISLPIYPELTTGQIEAVASAVCATAV